MVGMSDEPALVYDRIDSNRRTTVLLLALFSLILLPAAAYVAQYLTAVAAIGLLSLDQSELALGVGAAVAVGLVAAAAYLQFHYASGLFLRLAGARHVERDAEPDLWRTVENLCIGAGLPQPKVYVVESEAANAFSTGLNPKEASLVVTRGLLDLLDPRELEGVVAHELSHIGNYDTRLNVILSSGVGLLRLPFTIIAKFVGFLFRLHWIVGAGVLLYMGLPLLVAVVFSMSLLATDTDLALLFLLLTALPLYVVLVAPLLGMMVRRAVLRERELMADADAFLLTRHPEGLATALVKMEAAEGRGRRSVGAAAAALYIVDPLSPDAPWWDRILSAGRATVQDRVAAISGMGGGVAPSALEAAKEAAREVVSARGVLSPVEVGQPTTSSPTIASPGSSSAPQSEAASLVAARLTDDGTDLLTAPDETSKRLAVLPRGALITVMETHGPFMRVLTSDDRFGYISASTAMKEVDRSGLGLKPKGED